MRKMKQDARSNPRQPDHKAGGLGMPSFNQNHEVDVTWMTARTCESDVRKGVPRQDDYSILNF